METQSTKKHLIRLFPRHVVPDELSLLSLYEIIIYLLLLGACVYFYNAWNKIPVIEKNICIEELGTYKSTEKKESLASIQFYIPNSTVFADSSAHYRYTLSMLESTSHIEYYNANDSLRNAFFAHRPAASRGYAGNLFYFSIDAPKRFQKLDNHIAIDTVLSGSHMFSDYHVIRKEPIRVIGEQFINGNAVYYVSDLSDGELTKPSFISLRDITQAYYRIRIHSHSIDSITVRFEFKGVVEISPMGDIVPNQLSGNQAVFSFKPDYQPFQQDSSIVWLNKASLDRFAPKNDHISTIQFHMKSKDMENAQSRRVFLVTAILSALVTIFLAFFIIFFYRLFRRDKEE